MKGRFDLEFPDSATKTGHGQTEKTDLYSKSVSTRVIRGWCARARYLCDEFPEQIQQWLRPHGCDARLLQVDAAGIARHSVNHYPHPHITGVFQTIRKNDRDLTDRVETRHWADMLNRKVKAAKRRIPLDQRTQVGIEVIDK